MGDTLVLNSNYMPLNTINWKIAIALVYKGTCRVEAEYEDWVVHSANESWNVPSVIVTNEIKKFRPDVAFSRKNVYIRDRFRCQYCTKKFSRKFLTFDHVIPKSRGGKTTWENIVTCCQKCNAKKADKTPAEARFKLMKEPVKPPHIHFVMYKVSKNRDRLEQWKDFIFWHADFDEEDQDREEQLQLIEDA